MCHLLLMDNANVVNALCILELVSVFFFFGFIFFFWSLKLHVSPALCETKIFLEYPMHYFVQCMSFPRIGKMKYKKQVWATWQWRW